VGCASLLPSRLPLPLPLPLRLQLGLPRRLLSVLHVSWFRMRMRVWMRVWMRSRSLSLSRLLSVALLMTLAAGCRVGPDYRPPALPPGAEAPLVSRSAAATSTDLPPDDWWRLYSDPRLDGLLQEAFAANADLAAAAANFAAARTLLAAARVARYPETAAKAAGIYGRDAVTDEILELGGRQPQNIWLFEDILEVSYEVDLFGRVRRSVEASRANAEAVAAALDSLKVVVAAETTRAYAQVCALGEQLAAARRSLEVVSREAEITRNRHEAGANSEFDVVRADGLVAQIRSAIAPLEGTRRAALFQLTALLGRTPVNAPHDLDGCIAPPTLSGLMPVGDGASLLKRRPDVRQAERSLAAATARIGVASADLYPRISLTGLYGGVGTELSALTTNQGLAWGIGPSISWSFPNQALPRARVRQARAGAAAALAGFDSVVLNALKETEQALARYGSALDNRQSLADAQSRAHQAFRMANDQFLLGSLSNLDLLSTEQSLVAADAAVAASDSELVEDQIAVFKALGGGWRQDSPAERP
jgi:NodT family efflux transporter outer membrane factor (OMF) lipoprotein